MKVRIRRKYYHDSGEHWFAERQFLWFFWRSCYHQVVAYGMTPQTVPVTYVSENVARTRANAWFATYKKKKKPQLIKEVF